MVTYSLRSATIDDAAALAKISADTFLETFGHLYTPQNRNRFILETYTPDIQAREIADDEHQRHVLAFAGNALVGFVKFGTYKLPMQPPLTPAKELHRLYVLKSHHGQGIGAALMGAAMEYFSSIGTHAAYLGVYENNQKAQAFYKRYGFAPVGEYAFMVGDHADRELILMKEF